MKEFDRTEKIKTEYMLMEVEVPSSVEEVGCLLDTYIDDMRDARVRARREFFRNSVEYSVCLLESFFTRLFIGEENDLSYLDDDIGVITSQRRLGEIFGGYFKEMRKCLSEDNYQDVSRLALFTNKNYLDNYRRLEVIRDGIECSSRGFRVISGSRDTSHEFDEFFREEFTSITTKGLEKTKKI